MEMLPHMANETNEIGKQKKTDYKPTLNKSNLKTLRFASLQIDKIKPICIL